MSTRLTYRAAVLLKGYDALSTATIDAAVEEARRRVIGDHRWSFLQSSNATISTVASTATISLSTITDLAHVDAIRLSDTSGRLPMDWRPRDIIRDMQDNCPETGTPRYWTKVNNTIVFYPTPDRVYTVTVEYVANPTALAADATICPVPDRMADLVVWAACVPLSFRQRDLQSSSAADQFYVKVLLPRHRGEDNSERQTAKQIRTGYWAG